MANLVRLHCALRFLRFGTRTAFLRLRTSNGLGRGAPVISAFGSSPAIVRKSALKSSTRIAASCLLVTAPNLLRQGRRHGFLENVVTHPDYRGRGFGRAVVNAALASAWEQDCFHVFLQSGRADPRVHRFYETCGFEPGLRTAYVAKRPG